MTFETDFADLMVDYVTFQAKTTKDKYGVDSYAAAVSVQGRLVRQTKMVRAADGREVVSSAHFYTAGSVGLEVTDKATFADGSTPLIIRVDSYPDEDGEHHEVIYF